jgi:hypothetical protein
MANNLSAKGIGIASAAITGIIYILCFIIVFIAGDSSLKFFNLFVHGIDLTGLTTTPSIGTGIIGLIVSIIIAYVAGWLFAKIYNKYSE